MIKFFEQRGYQLGVVASVKEAGEGELKRNVSYHLQHSKKIMLVGSRSGTSMSDIGVIRSTKKSKRETGRNQTAILLLTWGASFHPNRY